MLKHFKSASCYPIVGDFTVSDLKEVLKKNAFTSLDRHQGRGCGFISPIASFVEGEFEDNAHQNFIEYQDLVIVRLIEVWRSVNTSVLEDRVQRTCKEKCRSRNTDQLGDDEVAKIRFSELLNMYETSTLEFSSTYACIDFRLKHIVVFDVNEKAADRILLRIKAATDARFMTLNNMFHRDDFSSPLTEFLIGPHFRRDIELNDPSLAWDEKCYAIDTAYLPDVYIGSAATFKEPNRGISNVIKNEDLRSVANRKKFHDYPSLEVHLLELSIYHGDATSKNPANLRHKVCDVNFDHKGIVKLLHPSQEMFSSIAEELETEHMIETESIVFSVCLRRFFSKVLPLFRCSYE